MATRAKTLWYATKLDADLVDATLTALDQITIYTENSSRVFRSVKVWIGFEDKITATGGTIDEFRVACSVDSAAATTITETDDISHSGENLAGILGPYDFTSHFTANYPGADSATLDISVYFDQSTGTTLGMRNVSALIAITYEYDDAAGTQYMTDIVPLESAVGALPTVETELGTDQIPQLTGAGGDYENIAGVTVRQQFFLAEGSNELNSTTDYTVNMRIDTGATKTFNATEMALNSGQWHRYIHIESPDPASNHAFKIWTTGIGAMNHCSVTMFVTYQFTVSGSTAALNCVLIPFQLDEGTFGADSTDNSRIKKTFYVPEPATVALKQSAYKMIWSFDATLGTFNTRAGSQAYRGYTNSSSGREATSQNLQQRIDSGGAQGAGLTLSRGENSITIDAYRTNVNFEGSLITGVIILRYRSGLHADGVGAHTHSTFWITRQIDLALDDQIVFTPTAPNIPEANYWVTGIGYYGVMWQSISSDILLAGIELKSGEGGEDGFRGVFGQFLNGDAERGCRNYIIDCEEHFDRHPNDPDSSRMAVETSRKIRLFTDTTSAHGMSMIVTYHSITVSVSGDVSNSVGGTVNLVLYDTATDKPLTTGSRTGNGSYTLTWYDDVESVYVTGYEDATHKAMSKQAAAGTGFDLDLNPGGGGGGLMRHPGMTGGVPG